MRWTITKKLIAVMLVLTVIPLAVVGLVAIGDANRLGLGAAEDARKMGAEAVTDAATALCGLGETLIRQRAEDVAKMLSVYIKDHPRMTIPQLQADEDFKQLVIQPVGKTGYTVAHDALTLINRFHVNPQVANSDLHDLEKKLPSFFAILAKNQGGNPSSGYYDWEEKDHTIRKKYLHIAMTDSKTADGAWLAVAATTYIDEFNAPAAETKRKIDEGVAATQKEIQQATESLGTKNTILMVTGATILIVIGMSTLMARTITGPLRQLTEVGNRLKNGDIDIEIPEIHTTDEIRDLGESLKGSLAAVRFLLEEAQKRDSKG